MNLKTNGDGRVSGCRGIIRGSNGECKGGFVKHIKICHMVRTGLWDIFEGLKLTMELGFSKVELNVDSTIIIGMLNSGNATGIDSISLLDRIMWLMKRIWELKVNHTYREANHYVDALVKYEATSGEDLRFGEDFPEIISHLMHSNSLGSSVPRLILL